LSRVESEEVKNISYSNDALHRIPASGRIEIRRGMFPMHSYWEIPDDTANGDDTKRVISVAENVSIKVSTNDKSHFLRSQFCGKQKF
jgi:hypothetical protein